MKKLLLTILKTLIFFVGWAVLLTLVPDIPVKSPALLRLWWEFVPFALIVAFTVLFVFLLEKGRVRVPMLANGVRNALVGIATGAVWLGSSAVILMMTSTLKVESSNSVASIWVWVLASLLNVAMQELLVRGYLYQLYKINYHKIAAMIVTTVLFTAMHGGLFEAGALAVLNVVTMSVFVTILLEYTGTLLAPILAHFVWNTVGAIVLGGVSLADDYPHLLNSTFTGNALLSGGAYRLEGSIVVLAVNVLLIAAFLVLYKKKAKKENLTAEPQLERM